jgi:O-antigen/teichoic acid export membrane protein
VSSDSISAAPDNTGTVARNSFWYSLELFGGFLGAFLVSILVAQIIGPERLGYYTYVTWLTNVTAAVGAFGLPMTARKYMAEYFGSGERGLARAVYSLTLRIQTWIAFGVTALGLVIVFVAADPTQRLISVILVLNMAPRMIGFIPSQANNATEVVSRNTLPALVCSVVTVSLTLFSLWVGWDLVGVAASVLAGTLVDLAWKLRVVHSLMRDIVPAELPAALRRKMFLYSSQGIGLMLLNVVVWDRSDILFLKNLNPDIRQVTFFSYAFNLVERLLMFPTALGGSVGITIMAQYGRGEGKLGVLTVEGARYALLVALPLLVGTACVAGPAAVLLYGGKFRPMIPVLAIMALLAIPKALSTPPTLLLQATENQGFLVTWGCLCAVVNIALDILLCPRYGAVGAAVANGSAQTLNAIGIWVQVRRLFAPDLRLKAFARIGLSALGMAAVAIAVSRAVPNYAGFAASIVAGAVAWLALLRFAGALEPRDAARFLNAGRALPGPLRGPWEKVIGLLAASGPASPPSAAGA